MNTQKAKALIALGYRKTAIVLATDSACLERDVHEIGNNAVDIGIITPQDSQRARGLYLWTGTIKSVVCSTWESDMMLQYDGTLREVGGKEIEHLLTMRPPEEEMQEATA